MGVIVELYHHPCLAYFAGAVRETDCTAAIFVDDTPHTSFARVTFVATVDIAFVSV
jgi:hypothetical protein